MSFVPTDSMLAASTKKLRAVGTAVSADKAAAAAFPAGVALAGADEALVRMAMQFTAQAEMLRAIRAQAPAILRQLVEVLSASPGSHPVAQVTNSDARR
ncbi:MAG: PE domain-containing protein [Mycobacterium sp.]|uniref:PE domain-containing protein n=1 Tax=Mycobacterium sp. TaxID=1785 RepID=UPI00284CF50E|nr:PE domain-containing protein [Mycobacterium sp.]HKI43449.1 PE domain-containing protein [Mycobacterium sp.]